MSEIDIKLGKETQTLEQLHRALDYYHPNVRKIILNGSAHAHFQNLLVDPNTMITILKGIPVFVDEHSPDWIRLSSDEVVQVRSNERVREESGTVVSGDRLVSFLYLLMRDYVPCGTVEKLFDEAVKIGECKKAVYTNGWLAKYAMNVASDLRGK